MVNLQNITLNQLEQNFDDIISRVQNGESFLIKTDNGHVYMTTMNSAKSNCDDELLRIYMDHEEGS